MIKHPDYIYDYVEPGDLRAFPDENGRIDHFSTFVVLEVSKEGFFFDWDQIMFCYNPDPKKAFTDICHGELECTILISRML